MATPEAALSTFRRDDGTLPEGRALSFAKRLGALVPLLAEENLADNDYHTRILVHRPRTLLFDEPPTFMSGLALRSDGRQVLQTWHNIPGIPSPEGTVHTIGCSAVNCGEVAYDLSGDLSKGGEVTQVTVVRGGEKVVEYTGSAELGKAYERMTLPGMAAVDSFAEYVITRMFNVDEHSVIQEPLAAAVQAAMAR